MSVKWDIDRSEGSLTLSRGGRMRFDVAAQTDFPNCARARLAHQIRQDLWRALQHVRGLSPVVLIERSATGLHVKAGGEIQGNSFPKDLLNGRIESVLRDPKKRARWLRFAALPEVEKV